MEFNKLLQLSRLQYLFVKDLVLNRKLYSSTTSFSKKAEYDLNIIRNIADNYNDNVYKCLSILLNENNLDRKVFFDKLLKYRYFDSKEDITSLEEDMGFFGGFNTCYDDSNNPISYNITSPDDINILLHEFYHFASFNKHDEIDYSGFKKGKIGKGINEGFTQYITNLAINDGKMIYQGSNGPVANYPFCTMYSKALTSVLGMDVMKDNYFNKGLDGLTKEIYNIYPDSDKIVGFLENMDYLYLVDGGKNNNKYDTLEAMKEIDSFLIDLCMLKHKESKISEVLPRGIKEKNNRLFPTDLLYEVKSSNLKK